MTDSSDIPKDLFIDDEEDDAIDAEAGEGATLFVDEDDDDSGAATAERTEGDGTITDSLRTRVEELEAALAEAQEEVAAANEKVLRKAADLENARRRHQREREDGAKYAAEGVLKDMAPILDDLQRALQHVAANASADDSLVQGVDMVARKFQQSLERRGVVVLESVGKAFDPTVHEAIQQVSDDTVPHNTVVQEFQRGYLLHDRLLRPALVVVAQGGPPRPLPDDGHAGDGESGAADLAEATEPGQDD
ncbi:MAG: nucleotide exchange factor GrpE [Myxococcales bacterium]|nr:nucleotide exchange factor GrpE [Myxococcales bacterium]MCB9521190.1 nucleotide exchange factor GrpE [Myxococcales bacterium]MCB9530548.1 nucleotide exchange factor GrpE [Myxococcales bacterium]